MLRSIFRGITVVGILLLSSGAALAAKVDAIAVDDDTGTKAGDAGFGVGEGNTPEEANKDALKNCKSFGNKGCEVAITYTQCGAYASSKQHSGAGKGATEGEAKKAALDECGNSSCKIVTSDCVGK